MKLYFKNYLLVVEAENITETVELFDKVARKDVRTEVKEKRVKPHKKHQFKKSCDVCGKMCKGIQGVGIHKATVHGVMSKNYGYQKKYREKVRAAEAVNLYVTGNKPVVGSMTRLPVVMRG